MFIFFLKLNVEQLNNIFIVYMSRRVNPMPLKVRNFTFGIILSNSFGQFYVTFLRAGLSEPESYRKE